jgi:hypothetical protein
MTESGFAYLIYVHGKAEEEWDGLVNPEIIRP